MNLRSVAMFVLFLMAYKGSGGPGAFLVNIAMKLTGFDIYRVVGSVSSQVPIVGPYDLGPTWKNTGKQGWIELANTVVADSGTHQYLLTISATDGKVVSFTQLN